MTKDKKSIFSDDMIKDEEAIFRAAETSIADYERALHDAATRAEAVLLDRYGVDRPTSTEELMYRWKVEVGRLKVFLGSLAPFEQELIDVVHALGAALKWREYQRRKGVADAMMEERGIVALAKQVRKP